MFSFLFNLINIKIIVANVEIKHSPVICPITYELPLPNKTTINVSIINGKSIEYNHVLTLESALRIFDKKYPNSKKIIKDMVAIV
ncbi:MAG: hypothetical protein CMP66_07210 [Flavobacteriales bacterium]|nr:hypothetical protein [Flavobacteriales bacterium]